MRLSEELRQKKICRFCLAQPSADLTLTKIYGKSSKAAAVPLPLQIMAATGIEVYETDGLPTTICFKCRVFTQHAYKFKQMARKAEEQLRKYPSTGVWPEKLQLPFEQIVLDKPKTTKPMAVAAAKADAEPEPAPTPVKQRKLLTKTPPKDTEKLQIEKVDILNLPIISLPDTTDPLSTEKAIAKMMYKGPPKILNKCHASNVPDDQIKIISVVDINHPVVPSTEGPALVIDTQVYACKECDRSFPLRQLLDIHIKSHNRERNFPCRWCDKHFFSKYDLAKHTMMHTGVKPHTCQVCNKSFSRSTLLTRHQKIHSDAPKFLCTAEQCDQYFLSAADLNKHMEAKHLLVRPYSCTKCKKSFAYRQGLDRHEAVHNTNQPFVCEYCDEGFGSSSKLAHHLTFHSKYRRYPCKHCSKSFRLSHHLTRHLKIHDNRSVAHKKRHPPIQPITEPYKCQYADCSKAFATKDSLIYHSAVHATESLMCPLCYEQFEDIVATTNHIELHSMTDQYACSSCDLIFVSESKLEQHLNTSHVVIEMEEAESESRAIAESESRAIEIQKAIQKLSKNVTVTREKKV